MWNLLRVAVSKSISLLSKCCSVRGSISYQFYKYFFQKSQESVFRSLKFTPMNNLRAAAYSWTKGKAQMLFQFTKKAMSN